MYLHEHPNWTLFTWNDEVILPLISEVRFAQGKLLGKVQDIGYKLEVETERDVFTNEIIASSKIEGIQLDKGKVRSSVSRQLGIETAETNLDTHDVDGYVSVMLDATKNYRDPITDERIKGWHAALFPTGYSGLHKINVAAYRKQQMNVVSGAIGKEKIHYTAPSPDLVNQLMSEFINWLDSEKEIEPLLKAGIAHIWFLTIHPFDDGNGRIAKVLTELFLTRSDKSERRFYSMARTILSHRKEYYDILELSQKSSPDITQWLAWFLNTLLLAIIQSDKAIDGVLDRSVFWKNLETTPLNERQRKVLEKFRSGFEGKLTSSKWAKICKVSHDTALRDIKDLVDKGILKQSSTGGRSTSYVLIDE